MKKAANRTEKLRLLFHEKTVLTMVDLKKALDTNSRMTIHRQLSVMDYISSYSHAGKYYSLNSIAHYNRLGLWEFNGIWFSKYGTLSKTIVRLIHRSPAGYFASELESVLHVFVHNELLNLYRQQQVAREQIGSEYLYLSTTLGKSQLEKRKQQLLQAGATHDETVDYLRTLLSVLNEKQRRLVLGFESLRIGHGGDRLLSEWSGVNVKAIRRGRRELVSQEIEADRIRREGGGRPVIKKN
jgi:hypothetical protein